MDGSLSLFGDAVGGNSEQHWRERVGWYAPRLAKEDVLSFSSCMAGSSDVISPLASNLFQHPQWGQR